MDKLTLSSAAEKIHEALINCEGIASSSHRFGGIEYRLGKREIGHIHGNYLVDIPFPMKVRNEILARSEAEPHHILPESGWVSIFIKNGNDINRAIALLKKSHTLAVEQLKMRIHAEEN